MKSKDVQNIVLSKYQNGDTPTEIYHDLNGGCWFNNNQKVVPDDSSIWYYQIIKSTRPSTHCENQGKHSDSEEPFTPQRKASQPKNYRWSLISLKEVSGEY